MYGFLLSSRTIGGCGDWNSFNFSWRKFFDDFISVESMFLESIILSLSLVQMIGISVLRCCISLASVRSALGGAEAINLLASTHWLIFSLSSTSIFFDKKLE